MGDKSYLFIVNPHARNGIVGNTWPKVEKKLHELRFDFTTRFTTHPKEAITIAKDENENFDIIVACGGDGTINEVVNGIYGGKAVFGLLPLGNGNDYATLLHYSKELDYNLEILQQQKVADLAVGLAEADTKHYFVNIAEVGITSIIAKAAYTELTWVRGLLKYYLIAMKKMISYNRVPATVTVDKREIDTELILSAVGLGYRFGGGFNVLPNNRPYFGDFGVCVAGDIAKWKWYYIINQIKKGTHIKLKGVHFIRGKKITIETEKPLPVETEGEVFSEKSTKTTFTIAEKPLPTIVADSFVKEQERYLSNK